MWDSMIMKSTRGHTNDFPGNSGNVSCRSSVVRSVQITFVNSLVSIGNSHLSGDVSRYDSAAKRSTISRQITGWSVPESRRHGTSSDPLILTLGNSRLIFEDSIFKALT